MRSRTVIFDCDSTLSTIEGIDVLAGPLREEIARYTAAAMQGTVRLEDVYGQRLARIAPTRDAVAGLGRRYVDALVPDAPEVVAALRDAGIAIRVLSGGIRPAVLTLTRHLGIPDALVDAVDVHFDAHGRYAGFDEHSPLARAGGKLAVVERWVPPLERPAMMVGDGITDLEARSGVDVFVAFAGVVRRAPVVAAADAVITSLSLAPVLPLALDGQRPSGARAGALFDRGLTLLRTTSSPPPPT